MAYVERNEFDYGLGPHIQMKGSGGGGGGSGAVSWPAYMQNTHYEWLAAQDLASNRVTKSLNNVLNAAFATNPYAGLAAFEGATDVSEWEAAIALFSGAVNGMAHEQDWLDKMALAKDTLNTEFFDSTKVDAVVEQFSDLLDQQLAQKVYPIYEAGMRDVGAVVSSSFALGKAAIIDGRNAQVAKYDAELRYKYHLAFIEATLAQTKELLTLQQRDIEYKKLNATLVLESKRIKIIASREHVDQDAKVRELEATWEFEAYAYAANMIASIGGGTSQTGTKNMSPARSAIGGAMSGAAMGVQIAASSGGSAGVWGAAGAVVGGAAGYLTA
jgi:hypothetical protein